MATVVTGLKYDANNIYLAANYGETRNATPITNKPKTPRFRDKNHESVSVSCATQFDFRTSVHRLHQI